jgi:DNA uptake protein ComE-like DNA-binding protein
MATTEQLIERMGGGGTVGLAVAAVALAPTLLPPVRRGLRGLAKAAIIQYLRVTEPRAGGVTEGGASGAVVAGGARRPRRAGRTATEAPAPTAATPASRSRPRRAAGAAAPSAPPAAASGTSRSPRRPRAQANNAAAPPAATTPERTSRPRRAAAPAPAATRPAERPRRAAPAAAPAQAERPSEAPRAAGRAGQAKLNLNTATRAELTRLPRVGEQTADRIIQFREQQGPITGVRQLRNADVLSAAAWRNIRDLVRF